MSEKRPFLSIVTRHLPERKALLERNQRSVAAQTDRDLEQVLVTDDEKRGLVWADANLASAKNLIRGEYVYVLDDDDYLVDAEFVAKAKEAAREHEPGIIFVRMRRLPFWGKVLPCEATWGRPPSLGYIGSPCFVVKRELWVEHIEAWGQPAHGDYYFITKVYNTGCAVVWLDRVVAEVDRIGSVK